MPGRVVSSCRPKHQAPTSHEVGMKVSRNHPRENVTRTSVLHPKPARMEINPTARWKWAPSQAGTLEACVPRRGSIRQITNPVLNQRDRNQGGRFCSEDARSKRDRRRASALEEGQLGVAPSAFWPYQSGERV